MEPDCGLVISDSDTNICCMLLSLVQIIMSNFENQHGSRLREHIEQGQIPESKTAGTMAFEHQFDYNRWKSLATTPKDSENQNGCFDCNICLDFANDPVVTLCGHLYCWPCIHKWFHVQSTSLPSDEYPQCPVCKAEISHTTVIPLYGRGQSATKNGVPPRPQARGPRALLNAHSNHPFVQHRDPYHGQQRGPYMNSTQTNSPVVGMMFGEMVYARVFGNSYTSSYPNSYHAVGRGTTSARLRRLEMQADKSLSRISLFLFCCFLLCLLLF